MSETAPAGAVRSGQAFVEFFAVDGKLNKSLTKIGNQLKAFGDFSTKAGAALTAAGTGAAAGFVAAAKSFADAGSAIDDASQRTGVGAERLSAFAYAATMSGTSLEAFETGLKGMAKAMFAADEEGKAAVKTLSNLGLSVEALRGATPDEAFLVIAEALSKVEDPTRRAALSMKIFGKSGSDLLPLMNGGRKGIVDLLDAAEKLGVTMTDKDAQAAAALGDAMDELRMTIGGVTNAVGAAVAGPLTEWAAWFRDQIPEATKWAKENESAIATVGKISAGTAIAGSALTAFGVAATGVGLGLSKITSVALGVSKSFGAIAAAAPVIAIAGVAYGIARAIKHWAGNQDELNRQIAKTNRLNAELAMAHNSKAQQSLDENKAKGSLSERRRDIDDKVAMAEKNLQGSATGVAMAQKNLTDASGWGNTVVDMTMGSAKLDALRQDLKDAEGMVETQRGILEKFREQKKEIEDLQAKENEDKVRKPMADLINGGLKGATQWGTNVVTKGAGLAEAGMENARKKVEDAKRLEEHKKQSLEDNANAIKESQKTPAQLRQERLDQLDKMREKGLLSDPQVALERTKIGLEATQEKADKLEGRTQGRESLNLGISEDQKSLLAAQAGRMSVEDETRKNTGDAAKTLEEVLTAQRQLNAYLTANGISLVEIGGAS